MSGINELVEHDVHRDVRDAPRAQRELMVPLTALTASGIKRAIALVTINIAKEARFT